MARLPLTLALLAALILGPASPGSGEPARLATEQRAGVEVLANLPEMHSAIAIGFIRDTMFVSTTFGLYSYDVSDPAAPRLVGALPMYLWENEDMAVDAERELVFLSRDSRGFTTHYVPLAAVPLGILHVIDVSDPGRMVQVGSVAQPIGHTASCVDRCRYVWVAGISRGVPGADAPAKGGRAVWAVDVRDPANPVTCGPFDDGGSEGSEVNASHDVFEDEAGVAWISGGGGVWGYWTRGRHVDPRDGKVRTATGCDPIPYGGGKSPASATPSRFMHNAWRNLRMRAAPDAPRGTVLLATEESITSDCATSGRFAAYDLRGSLGGRAWRRGGERYFMKVLDTWTPEGQPGASGCDSAHWFEDRGDGLLAYAFYGQGVRFVDASNPRRLRQVGYYVPELANAWAAYWRGDVVYVADYNRGVDVLRVTAGRGSRTVRAAPVEQLEAPRGDPAFGFTCRLPL